MNLQAWLDSIGARHPQSIELGLERVGVVASRMGFQKTETGFSLNTVSIVVGGTNGKGSTCAMLESILLASGYKVATYTSPHLIHFTERLRLNGASLADDQWIGAFERVEDARQEVSLTYFEFTTLAAFDLVKRADVDVAILEIGLGGRLDAVNLIDNDCAILTSVDLDHQAFLGDTREKIGWEKAHIARKGRPFIVADPLPPDTVKELASSIGADLWLIGKDFNYQGDRQQWSWAGRGVRRNAMAYPALRGANQLLNASGALAALASLRDKLAVTQGAVRQGFALVSVDGRFQVLPGQPSVVLDVAHNPHAASVLAANLDQMGFFPNTYAVVGILRDKDAAEIFRRIGDRVDHWLLASIDDSDSGSRSRLAQELSEKLREAIPNASFACFDSPRLAYEHAQSRADPSDRIVVFGSFLTVAQVIQNINGR